MNVLDTVFFMTTNNLHKISDAVKSRSFLISFHPSSPDIWLPLARQLFIDEGVPNCHRLSTEYLLKLIISAGNNARDLIGEIQFEALKLKNMLANASTANTIAVRTPSPPTL